MVRAKFICNTINHLPTTTPGDVCVHIGLSAVYNNGEANRDWSKYTPAGSLAMTITNPSAIDQFELGKEYYLDFTPVERGK
jgi:hypothetical protein